MLTRRRVISSLVVLLFLGAAFVAYQSWQVQRDLTKAESSVDDLVSAVNDADKAAQDRAIGDFQEAASSAHDRTDGPLWSVLTKVPILGDDADGVRSVSASLQVLAEDGVDPLSDSLQALDGLSSDGRIDVDVVRELQDPVAEANVAFASAVDEVAGLDSRDYVGAFRSRFDDYVNRVEEASDALASAETATKALPDMVGADGPRDYLLLFQNNAEIRATGGMPGSWALIHADNGRLSMAKQGVAGDFPMSEQPVVPLSEGEVKVYGKEIGTYFQDPGFTPDFPRAAEIWGAHWQRRFPATQIDGVLALDPVGMSYMLEGTGPVVTGDTTLTADNVVEELLNKPYLTLEPPAQDALFQDVARAVFDAATGDLESPEELVSGLARAAKENRFLVAPFVESDAARLKDSAVLGALPEDDGDTPYVDIGLNDVTGSKMSYYLRYWADVEARSCADDTQKLAGTMSLSQSIAPGAAAELPDSVTGGGNYGTDPGSQLVAVRIYGPHDGTIDGLKIDGKTEAPLTVTKLDGRPVVTLAIILETRDDVVLSWDMTSGEGQHGAGHLGVTPSVVSGARDQTFPSAC
ncbi:MAG: DUF4012 domain-containing protein [Nocardioides sp.]|nr:DUF4012 domain-containing protein [Nocardioides sp.]